MLYITRKDAQVVYIGSAKVVVYVQDRNGKPVPHGRVVLGIEAPADVNVVREEVRERNG